MSNPMPMNLGSVVSLWRYPVKSMMGEELNAAEITERGLLGDRQEFVGWWEPSRVKGGRQILVRVSGESPSISRQIRAPAASVSAPSATQTEVIARGQRSW